MSQMYTIVSIIGFSLAAVLAVTATAMFFMLHIKDVRDDLTGKTVTRSIAEIRSRAKTRKRPAPAAAQGLGWNRGAASGELDAFTVVEKGSGESALPEQAATPRPDGDAGAGGAAPDTGTSLLSDDEGGPAGALEADLPADGGGGAEGGAAEGGGAEGGAAEGGAAEGGGIAAGTAALCPPAPKKAPPPAAEPSGDEGGAVAAGTAALCPPAPKKAAPGGGTAIVVAVLIALIALPFAPREAEALGAARPAHEARASEAPFPAAGGVSEGVGGALLESPLAQAAPSLLSGPSSSATVTITFKQDPRKLVVPYGADPAAWLSAQDIFTVNEAPSLSHDEIARLFEDGRIVRRPAPPAPYPRPNTELAGSLAWGTLKSDAQLLFGESFGSLSVTMGEAKPWLLDGVQVGDLSEDEAAARITGSGESARFWVNGSLRLASASAERQPLSFVCALPGADAPAPSAFPDRANALDLPDPGDQEAYPTAVYARALADLVFNPGTPDEARLAKGEIVRLPLFCLDTAKPSGGGSARLKGGSSFDGTLYASSLEVRIDAVDEAASSAAKADEASGIASASLEYEDASEGVIQLSHIDLGASERGAISHEFPFKLNQDGAYDADRLYVRVADVAGNERRVQAGELLDERGGAFDPVLSRIVLSTKSPQVRLVYEPSGASPSGFYVSRTAVLTIEDDNYAALRARYDAMTPQEQAATAPVASFVNTSLPADDPARVVSVSLGDVRTTGGIHQARITLSAEGSYQLAEHGPSYEGIVPGIGAAWAQGSDFSTFSIDTTAPAPGRVRLGPGGQILDGVLYVPGDATVKIDLDDAASGVDGESLALTYAGERQAVGFEGDGALGGTVVWRIPADDALVDLSRVSLSFEDRLGNASGIPDLAAYADRKPDARALVADGAPPAISVSFDGGDALDGRYFGAPRTATVTLTEASFGASRAARPDLAVATRLFDGAPAAVAAKDFENPSGDGAIWVAEVPCAEDGAYRIDAGFTDASGRAAEPYRGEEFVVDTTAPAPGRASIAPSGPVQWGWLFSPGEAEVSIPLDDAASGVDGSSVAVASAGDPGSISFEGDGARGGTAVWRIPADDAFVDLSRVSLSFEDRLGNASGIPDLAAYADKDLPVKGIVADGAPPVISVSFDNDDVRNGKYYKAPRTARVTVDEATFSFVRDNDPDRTVALRYHDGSALKVAAKDFENPSGDGAIWVAEVPCAEDGAYRIDADFTDPSGKQAAPYRGGEFVVDTQAPTAGAVSISPHDNVEWGWLFAPQGASVSFAVSDELSGIDESSARLAAGGAPARVSCTAADDGARDATVRWDVAADDRFISLSSVFLAFADKAGNVAHLNDLEAYAERDLDVAGIVADGAPPALSVAFDNDDARNAAYYDADRTATVTVVEATFSFVRDNDPERIVATRYLNDSRLTVAAKDFENPSGDGVTWTAQIACDSDGAYRIDADFTDPSGKQAAPYRGEEFVVDKTKPLVMLTFDNNSAESGSYFKAPRTATIAVYDDNFSQGLASVNVSARDAAGNAAGAPGISGWTELPKGTWTTNVHFGEELHYAMNVACTDLAGNAAEPVEEPEFVIDMTPPVVKVQRVENHAAYKDGVAPLVSFSDTNFEPFLTDVSIAGAVHGDRRYFAFADSVDGTSRTMDYADFPYSLDADDVYTLVAKVKDKAGNAAEQQVVFSVNRFGSNYELSGATASLVGSYVKRGESVVVTETNVSGLASSAASIARNDTVRNLVAGSDYEVAEQGGQDAWSRYTYTFPAELFAQDGYYRVLLSSRDVAGGLSENLMQGKSGDRSGPLELSFAVDGTSPVASIGNVEGGAAYYAPSQRVDVYAADNMDAQRAVLTVDGAPVASWDADALKNQRAFSYELAAAEGPHAVRLEVTDRAGNTTVVSADGVLITNDLARYVVNTPAILYPAIAGAVVALSAAVLVAARVASRLRKRKG